MRAEASLKIKNGRKKLKKILEAQHPALMVGGIMATDMRIARASYEGGVRIFEPNHPAALLQTGLNGIHDMRTAERFRYEVPVSRMVEIVRGIRSVCGQEVFITVGCPGTFTEVVPTRFTLEQAIELSQAGADCLHTHKSSLEDVEEIAELCHRAGLMVEAYIASTPPSGVLAPTDELLKSTIEAFEGIGIDLIGLSSGEAYKGQKSGEFTDEFLHRARLFVETTKAITVLEGGITRKNVHQVRSLGADIIVVSTALDQAIGDATTSLVSEMIG